MWGLYCENRLLRSAAADDDVEEQKGKEDGTDSGRIMFWMAHTVLGLVLPLSISSILDRMGDTNKLLSSLRFLEYDDF